MFSLEDADDEQSDFAAKLMNLDKVKKTVEKRPFLNNLRLFFSAREKVLNNFKSRLFSIKNLEKYPTRESTTELATEPIKRSKSKLELQQELMNEIIADGKVTNDEIFWNYFKDQNPLFLAKDLIRAKEVKNQQLKNNINVD